jgi:hypothetical protein
MSRFGLTAKVSVFAEVVMQKQNKKAEFVTSGEVESVEWVKFSDAASKLREGSIARQLVETVIKQEVK